MPEVNSLTTLIFGTMIIPYRNYGRAMTTKCSIMTLIIIIG